MTRRIALAAALLFAALVPSARAQDAPPPASSETEPELIARAYELMDAGDYGGAMALLERAKTDYPKSAAVRVALASLFFDREFYDLAAAEYEAATALDPGNTSTWYSLADCYGRLNREEDSIAALKRTLELDPDNLDAIGELAWMRYKTHEIDDGIELLLDAVAKHGMNRGFAMTLGTLYSELYDYEKAESHYRTAIKEAIDYGDRHFAAIALYNLSLLHTAFWRWDEAMATTDESLAQERRTSGLLARGELHQRRQDFRSTFADYEEAFPMDKTPLSRLDIADACLEAGRLDEALSQLDDVSKIKNHPWMVNFGINPESFAQSLHDLYADVYDGLATVEALRPKRDLADWLGGAVSVVRWRILSAWHGLLAGKAARSEGDEYARLGNTRYADANRFVAFKRYPAAARRYLESLAAFDTALVPASKPMYDLERAWMDRDPAALDRALDLVDAEWERDVMAESLARLAKLLRGRGDRAGFRTALERLYLVNRGALRRNGFGVPVEFAVAGADAAKASRVAGALSRAGMELARKADDPAFSFKLTLTLSGHEASYVLASKKTGGVVASGRTTFASAREATPRAVADFLLRSIHLVEK